MGADCEGPSDTTRGLARRDVGYAIGVGTRADFRTTTTEALAATVVDAESSGSSRPSPFRTDLLPDVGDLVGNHYRLVRLLGKGMFGKVYVAERIDVPAHQVALKVVPNEVYSGRNVEREL